MVPMLLARFCPNINQDGHAVEAVQDLLLQLHNHSNIHLGKNKVVEFDENGYLVAVDHYEHHKEGRMLSEDRVGCSFIDHIAFYRNVGVKEQSRCLIQSARNLDYFAFENQADIMMIEHCPKTKEMMSSKDRSSRFMDIYHSVFRGELLEFALHIANNNFVGDTASFVVTESGGITHRDEAERHNLKYTECVIIKHIAANSDNKGQNGEDFDEEQFTPDSHGGRLRALEMVREKNAG